QGSLLRRSARVLRLAASIHAADVADADRADVVALNMGANFLDRAADRDGAVQKDQEVVADVAPAPRAVHPTDVGDREGLALRSGGAVDDGGMDRAHAGLP